MPRVNTVGLDFEDALDRRTPEVDVIDFDGMGNIGNNLVFLLQKIAHKRPNVILGVTILAGREGGNLYGEFVKSGTNGKKFSQLAMERQFGPCMPQDYIL
jgi:hypothetical protein